MCKSQICRTCLIALPIVIFTSVVSHSSMSHFSDLCSMLVPRALIVSLQAEENLHINSSLPDKLFMKSQIPIPKLLGRSMLGIVDETGLLEYGQARTSLITKWFLFLFRSLFNFTKAPSTKFHTQRRRRKCWKVNSCNYSRKCIITLNFRKSCHHEEPTDHERRRSTVRCSRHSTAASSGRCGRLPAEGWQTASRWDGR